MLNIGIEFFRLIFSFCKYYRVEYFYKVLIDTIIKFN